MDKEIVIGLGILILWLLFVYFGHKDLVTLVALGLAGWFVGSNCFNWAKWIIKEFS